MDDYRRRDTEYRLVLFRKPGTTARVTFKSRGKQIVLRSIAARSEDLFPVAIAKVELVSPVSV